MNDSNQFPLSHRIGIVFFATVFAVAVYFRWTKTPWIFHGYAIDYCWGYLYLEIKNRYFGYWISNCALNRKIVISAALAFGITFFLEVIQLWIPHRTHDVWDYLAYSLGIVTAMGIDLSGQWLGNMKRRNKVS
ncbi:MAG: hypothetical protein AAGA30_17070 [Planctomycetota bacterium]